jgi:hypothetical protein
MTSTHAKKSNTKSSTLKEIKSLNWDCTICGDILVEPTNFSGCGHVFCMECIQQWRFQSDSMITRCPNCREPSPNCHVSSKSPNLLLTQILDTIMPESYQDRKKEYFDHKTKHEIIRKFLGSRHVCRAAGALGGYMKDVEPKGVKIGQMAKAIKKEVPESKKPILETKLYLSTFLKTLVIIHKNRVIRRNTADMEQYIQNHADDMTGTEMAEFMQPTSTLNLELNSSMTGLSAELRDYVDKNLDRIAKYIENNFSDESEDDSSDPSDSDEDRTAYRLRMLEHAFMDGEV